MSLVAYESSDSDESGLDEGTTVLPVLPAPKKGSKRQAGPVKICLPSLDNKNLADSDDEDENLVSLPKRKCGGSGLAAILPQPKQATTKLVSKTTPTATPSSQNMVPYSLSRHGRAALGARKELKKKKPGKVTTDNHRCENSDSDDDNNEPVSFFSHLNTSHDQSVAEMTGGGASSGGVVYPLGGPDKDFIQAAPSAPRPFTQEAASTVDPALVTRLWEESVAGGDDYIQVAAESELEPVPHPPLGSVPVALPGAGPGLSMDEEAYRRLTGVRKKRGRDPSLNDLVEIKEDDVKVGMETYRKNFSEESVEKMYKAPDGSKPTAQQKRKHQLSFLAHHAKENELKLLKQWAQSAATRRDTQMKYGF